LYAAAVTGEDPSGERAAAVAEFAQQAPASSRSRFFVNFVASHTTFLSDKPTNRWNNRLY
jgi:hypothetical protein